MRRGVPGAPGQHVPQQGLPVSPIPFVWFVRDGEKLYLVPVRGSDSEWYKNVLKTPTIHLAVEAAQLNAIVPPTSDAAKVEPVLDQFRAKYGAQGVEAYYPKHDVAVEVRSPGQLGIRVGPQFVVVG